MSDMNDLDSLIAHAHAARAHAYAPYSKFSVGAALSAKDGRIFSGCNVENISFGLTICAERNAVAAAIADGCKEFDRIVIVSDSQTPVAPCGACRQVMAEFGADLEIVAVNLQGERISQRLGDLIPYHDRGILG